MCMPGGVRVRVRTHVHMRVGSRNPQKNESLWSSSKSDRVFHVTSLDCVDLQFKLEMERAPVQ